MKPSCSDIPAKEPLKKRFPDKRPHCSEIIFLMIFHIHASNTIIVLTRGFPSQVFYSPMHIILDCNPCIRCVRRMTCPCLNWQIRKPNIFFLGPGPLPRLLHTRPAEPSKKLPCLWRGSFGIRLSQGIGSLRATCDFSGHSIGHIDASEFGIFERCSARDSCATM